MVGEAWQPRSLGRSSSNSLPCPSNAGLWLLTLRSELALLLVARGESETLAVLLPAGPDLTLYIDDAGTFVINGRKFPGILRLISYMRELKYKVLYIIWNSFKR